MVKTIILINGKKRSGKDYLSKLLIKYIPNNLSCEIFSFAKIIKEIISKTFEITIDQLDDFKNKESHIFIDNKEITNMRKILQIFGSDVMKPLFGEDIWVKLINDKIQNSNSNFIIISDWRYYNEYLYLQKNNYNIITVNIKNENLLNTDNHSSEKPLYHNFDHIIDNTNYQLNINHLNSLLNKLILRPIIST